MIYKFFEIFKSGHIAADQVYFYELNSKKSAKFSFSKNHRVLKNKHMFNDLISSFNTNSKKKKKKKIVGPENGQNSF